MYSTVWHGIASDTLQSRVGFGLQHIERDIIIANDLACVYLCCRICGMIFFLLNEETKHVFMEITELASDELQER